MSIPNFDPVSIDEVIERADGLLAVAYPDDAANPIQRWVEATNAKRQQDKVSWSAEPFDVAGVTIKPGDVVTLSVAPRFSKAYRSLNCYVIDRAVMNDYSGRWVALRFIAYGGKGDGVNRWRHVPITTITHVEIITNPSPAVLENIEYGRSRGAFDV